MRPDTIFKWVDQSGIPTVVNSSTEAALPLMMMVSSTDRGPEDLMVVKGQQFFDLFGEDISFRRHGQPLLQAANIINAGGKLLFKRLVAPDATLANIIIYAKVKATTVQETNAAGQLLYIDTAAGGQKVTTDTGTPSMINVAAVEYGAKSIASCETIVEVKNAFETILDEVGVPDAVDPLVTVFSYPLFAVCENGRGASTKKFLIEADYALSRNNEFMFYNFSVVEGTEKLGSSARFAMDPDIIYSGLSMDLTSVSNRDLAQVNAYSGDDYILKFIDKVAAITGVDADEIRGMDFVFGKNRKGNALSYMKIDSTNGIDLAYTYGTALQNGTNGVFGTSPFGTDAWATEAVKLFNGTFTDEVYNRNTFKIDLILDANYPAEVKREAEKLAIWREDAVFFSDLGLDLTEYEDIVSVGADGAKSTFVAKYLTTYDIIDPYSRKQINVTMLYTLSRLLVAHMTNARQNCIAGYSNGFILSDAIEGTINFYPKVTPTVDQKTLLENERINWASYSGSDLIVESEYTSQEAYTQLSFINNVLLVQQVAKAIRTLAPKVRYQTVKGTSGEELDNYKNSFQDVINDYANNFASLEFVYTADPVMIANKIFDAGIEFLFADFFQTEIFTLKALPVSTASE